MATGTVKWLNAQKGYGFIEPSDGGNDVFVHISALERAGLSSLKEGQMVKYEVARPGQGFGSQPLAGRVNQLALSFTLDSALNSETPNVTFAKGGHL
jgi:CspA family cold shock protein